MVQIDHVVVLMLENRSFDHMLGYLDHPSPDFLGLRKDGLYRNPGWAGGAPVATSPDAKSVLPVDPDHAHSAVMQQLGLNASAPYGEPTNQGFVQDFERQGRLLSLPHYSGLFGPVINWWINRPGGSGTPVSGRGPLIMRCQSPEQVPVLSRLALDFAVAVRWHCPVPGETWPNRNFLHAATSDGETDIEVRLFTNPTVFELLEAHGHDWRIYHDDTPQVWSFNRLWDTPERLAKWFDFDRFAEHCAAGDLPSYTFIEPNHRPPLLHTPQYTPYVGLPDVSNNQHPGNNLIANADYNAFEDDATPDTDFTRAETLIASVYESLRRNPELFERTVLIITYDEHGGFYNHVPPPTDVPAPAGSVSRSASLAHFFYERIEAAFDFHVLGPRVPAVIVSPHIAAGSVDTTVRDHTAVPALLRTRFAPDAAPLTERDAWAGADGKSLLKLLTLEQARSGADLPDLSQYAGRAAAEAAGVDAQSDTLPEVLPRYFHDFVEQAELVWRRLAQWRTPETAEAPAPSKRRRGRQITEAFQAAAQQARGEAGRSAAAEGREPGTAAGR